MSIYTRGEPASNNQFRDTTARNAGKMANCTFRTFMCKKCNQPKSIQGRKSLGWKAGFACAECAQ